MAFCTQCGQQLVEGQSHVCHAQVQSSAATEPVNQTVPPSTGGGNAFAQNLLEQYKLGITNPDALGQSLVRSNDFMLPVIHYVVFGLTFGLMSAAFTNKIAASLMDLFSSIMGGGMDLGLSDTSIESQIPFGSIWLKTAFVMVILAASYACSFALVSRLFKGQGSLGDYFKAVSGMLIPASLVLLVSAVLVNVSIYVGLISFAVAFIYMSYFPFTQAKKISGLSTTKFVYTYPLVQVIPVLVLYILGKLGL